MAFCQFYYRIFYRLKYKLQAIFYKLQASFTKLQRVFKRICQKLSRGGFFLRKNVKTIYRIFYSFKYKLQKKTVIIVVMTQEEDKATKEVIAIKSLSNLQRHFEF